MYQSFVLMYHAYGMLVLDSSPPGVYIHWDRVCSISVASGSTIHYILLISLPRNALLFWLRASLTHRLEGVRHMRPHELLLDPSLPRRWDIVWDVWPGDITLSPAGALLVHREQRSKRRARVLCVERDGLAVVLRPLPDNGVTDENVLTALSSPCER